MSAPAATRQDTSSVITTTATATFLIALDSSLLHVGFPAIQASFQYLSPSQLAWMINIYSITLAALLVLGGYTADRYGRKLVLTAGLCVFALGAFGCGAAASFAMLVIARGVQAVGGALALPSSLAIVLASFEGRERAMAVGKWSAAGGLAAALGPPLGALLIQFTSWRNVFFLHLPICMWAIWRTVLTLNESGREPQRGKLYAAIPSIGSGIGMLAAALTIDLASRVRLALGIAGVAFIILGARAALGESRFVSGHGRRDIAMASLSATCFGAVFAGMFLVYDLALVYLFGFSVPGAALLLTPIPLLSVPVARRAGVLNREWQPGSVIAAGSLSLLTAVLLFLWLLAGARWNPAEWVVIVLLSSMGIGLCFPALSLASVKGILLEHFALASGLNQSCRQIGTVLGVVAVTMILDANTARAYRTAACVLAGFSMATLVAALCMRRRSGLIR